MNRRSFITKALAGLAVVPVLGKLVSADPQQTASMWEIPLRAGYAETVETLGPVAYFHLEDEPVYAALFTIDERGKTVELSGKGYERVPVQMDQAVFSKVLEDWPQVTHFSWGRNDEEIAANVIDLWQQRYCRVGQSPMLMTR